MILKLIITCCFIASTHLFAIKHIKETRNYSSKTLEEKIQSKIIVDPKRGELFLK